MPRKGKPLAPEGLSCSDRLCDRSVISCPPGCLSPPHFSQETNPGAPPGSFHKPSLKPLFHPVEGILDQGVVHGSDEDMPLCPHPEIAVGIDNVPDQRAVLPGNHLEKMPAVEAIRQSLALELENDPATRHILRHAVPHGARALLRGERSSYFLPATLAQSSGLVVLGRSSCSLNSSRMARTKSSALSPVPS